MSGRKKRICEKATSCPTGNYEKTLRGLCDICKPYVAAASKLKKYGGYV